MTDPSDIRVLYIEDDIDLHEMFRLKVAHKEYSVDIADNGEDGLKMHGADPYDILVIDYQLPGMTGIDVARKLLMENRDLPIVIVTATGNERIAVEALSLGVYNYVVKDNHGIYLETISDIIASALKRAEAIQRAKDAEKSLKLREAQFQDISETATDRFWEMDETFRFTVLFDHPGRALFPPVEKFIGRTRWEMVGVDPDKDEKWGRHRDDLSARRSFRDFQYAITDENGVNHHRSASGKPFYDKEGNFQGYRGSITDITERIQTELRLKESEKRFKDLAELTSDWFWEMGPDLRFTYFSKRFSEIAGFPAEDRIGSSRFDHLPPERDKADAENRAKHQADMEARRPFKNFEYTTMATNRGVRHVRISGLPIFDADGEFQGYRGTGTDITERKKVEEALERALDELEALKKTNRQP